MIQSYYNAAAILGTLPTQPLRTSSSRSSLSVFNPRIYVAEDIFKKIIIELLRLRVPLLPWSKGKPIAWDVTVADTFAESHLSTAAEQGADNKTVKYQRLEKTHIFLPVVIETAGSWS